MTPYYQDDLVTIYHGDCREWMPEADVIVTDPPYGMGYRHGSRKGGPMGFDLHRTGREQIDGRLHVNQKPVALMAWVLGFVPAGTVLDPFAGSGSTLIAAKELGRKSIGIEIEERYCEIAAQRCSQEVLGLA